MKRFEKKPFVFLAASIGCAAIFAIFRMILTNMYLEPMYGVYTHGAVIPDIFHAVLAIIIVAFGVTAYSTNISRDGEYNIPKSDFSLFTSFSAALILTFDLFLSLYNIYKTAISEASPSALDILEICFLLPAIFYFFGLTRGNSGRTLALILTSYFPTAWCAVSLIKVYFDNTVLMTSPNKIINEVALLSAMVYFLGESRIQLSAISHRLYLFTASAAPVLLTVSALPNLFMADKISLGKSDSTILYVTEIVFALFMWSRLAAYAKNPELRDDTVAVIENSDR